MATRSLLTRDEAYVPIGKREPILRSDSSEISLLVADENLSLTYASRVAGERVTDLHRHRHSEAFYVLEGELSFEIGAERETITSGPAASSLRRPALHTRTALPASARHAGSSSTPATAASPRSCAASATGSRSNGTSHRSLLTAASLQTTRSSVARCPSRLLPERLNVACPKETDKLVRDRRPGRRTTACANDAYPWTPAYLRGRQFRRLRDSRKLF